MLDINKEDLKKEFNNENWEYVFDKVYAISSFLVSSKFKVSDSQLAKDMVQECAVNFLKKIRSGKVEKDNNIFSFIWKNSTFRIMEMLRKQKKRDAIVQFVPYEIVEYEIQSYEDGEEDEVAWGGGRWQ